MADSRSLGDGGRRGPKTIEERYQKKTPIEHILTRPDSYIGTLEQDTQLMWIWDPVEGRMVQRNISFVPGLYKIFDEILVNAADVKNREENEKRGSGSQRMTTLKVDIDAEGGSVSVWNDGDGIPVEIHKEHGVYVPELIFGHLLTSDNYDDTEERVTGGRNGFGAKLTNIFSTKFSVECADSRRKRKFRMTWTKNMSTHTPPALSDYNTGSDFVKVVFYPDLTKFKLRSLMEDDIISLMRKRVYDIAGCTAVKVFLNGTRLPIRDFKSYVDLYFKPPLKTEEGNEENRSPGGSLKQEVVKIHEKMHRWEVVISVADGQFQQVSFVNSICTVKGGTHVTHVIDPLIQAILKKVNTKNKGGMELKNHHVKNHLWVFVNALIVNPTFDSQTKETLTLKISSFGSKCTLSDKTINAVIKSPIIDNILMWARAKQQVELQRKLKGGGGRTGRDRVIGIPKLEDANDAGGRNADQCVLILTEGDSAKTSCVAGLSVVGRDRFGVFPLRGKLLNVREASHKSKVENKEIQTLLTITGLQVGKPVESPRGLRYGSIMIMTDQDYDGSHIKGLLINMISHFWPNLLKYQGFLREFVTPIVKVSKGNRTISFYTLIEYERWRRENNEGKGWRIKYYKGLGTSTDQEFKEYFSQLDRHTLDFTWSGEEDGDLIDMAFNGKRAEDRKQWIQASVDSDEFIDHTQSTITYKDFINKELVAFSRYDVVRSIPQLMDGLKPVQRKVLFGVFKRSMKQEVKVAQLIGYIGEKTSYHHGEQSLAQTIVGMAQTFVGSNNVNLLQPCGQFGSRKEGGKDASAARYIFTKPAPVTRFIFPEADDPLLEYQNDDGTQIEPKYYVPVMPLVLCNGIEGIGTGWSSSIPNYSPREALANLRRYMKGEPMEPMYPWYRGYKGRIERQTGKAGAGGFDSVGTITKIDDETLEVTELPIRVWTQSFKEFLEELLLGSLEAEDEAKQATKKQASKSKAKAKAKSKPKPPLEGGRVTDVFEDLQMQGARDGFDGYRDNGDDDYDDGDDDEEAEDSDVSMAAAGPKSKAKAKAKAKAKDKKDRKDKATGKAGVVKRIFPVKILDYKDNSTHDDVHFTIKLSKDQMALAEREGLGKVFRLRKPIPTSNMTLFDPFGKVQKYESELDIIREFAGVRLKFYELRKAYLMDKLERERRTLDNKVRFILMIIEEKLHVNNRAKKLIVEQLVRHGFDPMSAIMKAGKVAYELERRNKTEEQIQEEAEREAEAEGLTAEEEGEVVVASVKVLPRDYDYLLGMSIYSLTKEKVDEARNQLRHKLEELEELRRTTAEQLWDRDIDALLEALDKQDALDEALRAESAKFRAKHTGLTSNMRGGRGKSRKSGSKAAAKKGSKASKKGPLDDFVVSETSSSGDLSDSANILGDSDSSYGGGGKTGRKKSNFGTKSRTSSPSTRGSLDSYMVKQESGTIEPRRGVTKAKAKAKVKAESAVLQASLPASSRGVAGLLDSLGVGMKSDSDRNKENGAGLSVPTHDPDSSSLSATAISTAATGVPKVSTLFERIKNRAEGNAAVPMPSISSSSNSTLTGFFSTLDGTKKTAKLSSSTDGDAGPSSETESTSEKPKNARSTGKLTSKSNGKSKEVAAAKRKAPAPRAQQSKRKRKTEEDEDKDDDVDDFAALGVAAKQSVVSKSISSDVNEWRPSKPTAAKEKRSIVLSDDDNDDDDDDDDHDGEEDSMVDDESDDPDSDFTLSDGTE